MGQDTAESRRKPKIIVIVIVIVSVNSHNWQVTKNSRCNTSIKLRPKSPFRPSRGGTNQDPSLTDLRENTVNWGRLANVVTVAC